MTEIEDIGTQKKSSKKIDPSLFVMVFILLAFVVFFSLKRKMLLNQPIYTTGVIIGTDKSAKGNIRLNYKFFVAGTQFKGFVPVSFCSECDVPCCQSGDSVIVRYQKNNPENNDLLHQLPKNATLTY